MSATATLPEFDDLLIKIYFTGKHSRLFTIEKFRAKSFDSVDEAEGMLELLGNKLTSFDIEGVEDTLRKEAEVTRGS